MSDCVAHPVPKACSHNRSILAEQREEASAASVVRLFPVKAAQGMQSFKVSFDLIWQG